MRFCQLPCLVLAMLMATAGSVFAQGDYLFRIQGSNTVGAKLAPECAVSYLTDSGVSNVAIVPTDIANEYEIRGDDPRKVIHIAAHGSSTGFKALIAEQADMSMSSRPIKDKEVASLSSYGDMRSRAGEHTVAIDGLAIIVDPSNPIDTLTTAQIAQLFAGEISNWSELGGYDAPVSTYARDDASGTWDTFKSLVLKKTYTLAEGTPRYESNDDLSDDVAAQRGAIGFTGLASVRDAKPVAVSDGGTMALKPNEFTVATEDYPLSRRLFFYKPPINDIIEVDEFVEYCQSKKGQSIVGDVGFVSQNVREVTVTANEDWPEDYLQLVQSAKRLTVNFRFALGSAKLDNKAMADIERVIAYLKEKESGYKVSLVGFTDAKEDPQRAQIISRFRALAVQGELLGSSIPVKKSYSLGAFMPVASNGDRSTRIKNARVEIWIEE